MQKTCWGFKYGIFSDIERDTIKKANWIIQKYKDNFNIVRMPNPTIDLVKNISNYENIDVYS